MTTVHAYHRKFMVDYLYHRKLMFSFKTDVVNYVFAWKKYALAPELGSIV
jgi:hypothetical protein